MAEKKWTDVWDWNCESCDAHGTERTKREAVEARSTHFRWHIRQAREELIKKGLVEACGEEDGKTLYRVSELGKKHGRPFPEDQSKATH